MSASKLMASNASELTKFAAALPPEVRATTGIDVLAVGLDACRVAAVLSPGVHPLGAITTIIFGGAIRFLELGLHDPDRRQTDLRWLGAVHSPRRKALLRRYGAAVIQGIEGAVRADLAEGLPRIAATNARLSPLFDALMLVEVIGSGAVEQEADEPFVSLSLHLQGWLESLAEQWIGPDALPRLPHPDELEAELSQALDAIHPVLRKKHAGARFSLDERNPDGPSQAAHSTIELMDRFLREVAPQTAVEEWCATTGQLHLLHDGNATKRAQLLFALQGLVGDLGANAADDPPAFIYKLVSGANRLRRSLQTLKHADTGDAAERARARRLMAQVESLLYLISVLRQMDAADSLEQEDELIIAQLLTDLEHLIDANGIIARTDGIIGSAVHCDR